MLAFLPIFIDHTFIGDEEKKRRKKDKNEKMRHIKLSETIERIRINKDEMIAIELVYFSHRTNQSAYESFFSFWCWDITIEMN